MSLGGAGILRLVAQQGDTRRETFVLVWPPWWVQDDVKQALFKKSQIWSDLGFQVFGISRQNCSDNFWNPGDVCGPKMLGDIFFFFLPLSFLYQIRWHLLDTCLRYLKEGQLCLWFSMCLLSGKSIIPLGWRDYSRTSNQDTDRALVGIAPLTLNP